MTQRMEETYFLQLRENFPFSKIRRLSIDHLNFCNDEEEEGSDFSRSCFSSAPAAPFPAGKLCIEEYDVKRQCRAIVWNF